MSGGPAASVATPPPDVLAAWIARQRWFAAKTRRITGVRTVDAVPLAGAVIVMLDVTLDDGSVHGYAAPLRPGSTVADALDDDEFCQALLTLMTSGGRVAGASGELVGHTVLRELLQRGRGAPARRLGGEQSNTSVLFGRAVLLKFFRRHVPGINPEVEIDRFLTERARFPGTPRLGGVLEYRSTGGAAALAIAQEFVEGARDGWEWMLEQLADFYAAARTAEGSPSAARVAEFAGPSLRALRRLGEQTGGLHHALSTDARDPTFAPEPITGDDIALWSAGIRAQLEAAGAVVGDDGALTEAPAPAVGLASLRDRQKIRHHGDFHLGQTLYRPATGEFMIIDFEGEPARPLDERRRKHAAVRDVAGLLRSLDYAAVAARRTAGNAGAPGGAVDPPALAAWGEAWVAEAERAYLAGYLSTAANAPFVPTSDAGFLAAVAAFELEKAAYEVVYEANHRPDWIDIPRRGLGKAVARLRRSQG